MIIGLGIDAVNTNRCKDWHTYSHKKLARILSQEEIAYCLESPKHSAERFAVRFAAREAFFKAWNSAFPDQYIPLLRLCRAIQVVHGANNLPQIAVNWPFLGLTPPSITVLFSLTHSDSDAIACVILQRI
jgi:phosphopantetheine--protein transferase-like protein